MQTTKIQIDEYTYEIGKLGTRAGIRAGALLSNALAPALKKLPEDGFNPVQIAAAFEPLLANPEIGSTFERLCDMFAAVTVVHGQGPQGPTLQPLPKVFDAHFTDRYDALMVWFWAALRWSMSSFLRPGSPLAELLARVVATGKSASQSPS